MNRFRILLVIVSLFALVSACGPSEAEYEKVVAERDALKQTLEETRNNLARIEADYQGLKDKQQGFEDRIKDCQAAVEKLEAEAKANPQTTDNSASPKKNRFYYEVKSGDTLLGIARKTGVPAKEIKEINNIEGSFIKPGQKLLMPREVEGGN